MGKQEVITIPVEIERNNDWSYTTLQTADWHWDHPKCRRKLLTSHLDQALERGADVFAWGDVICGMQGRFDRRSSKSDIREEHNESDYIDLLVNDFVDWSEPYWPILRRYTPGNHETALLKHHETNVHKRIVERLNGRGAECYGGGYQGYTRFNFKTENGNWQTSSMLKHHHGHGGGGVVTKGTLWPQRRAAWWPDADVVITGHIHESWVFPVPVERTRGGSVYTARQLHISTPGYKDETIEGDGWAVEKGMPPKPQGAWWVTYRLRKIDGIEQIVVTAEEAI